jgi:hypothetical protein
VELPADRAASYLRAIRAALQALAPNEDHVPLSEADAHLQALDPALGGDVLAPFGVDPVSGLPDFGWMERAAAEQAVARGGAREGPQVVGAEHHDWTRAARLDAGLAARMQARETLHGFLRQHPILPVTRLHAALRRRGEHWDYSLAYDRMMPGGGWMRLKVELSGPAKWSAGLLETRPDGGVTVDPGFRHLLARHSVTPIAALHTHLEESLSVSVPRVSRGFVGPFWFPGLDLPTDAPDALRGGLALHLALEVLGSDVHTPAHRDPWVPRRQGEPIPVGFGVFRERRFAVAPAMVPGVRSWAAACGAQTIVVPIRPQG